MYSRMSSGIRQPQAASRAAQEVHQLAALLQYMPGLVSVEILEQRLRRRRWELLRLLDRGIDISQQLGAQLRVAPVAPQICRHQPAPEPLKRIAGSPLLHLPLVAIAARIVR